MLLQIFCIKKKIINVIYIYIGSLLVLALIESVPCGWMYFLSSMTFSDCYENVTQKHQQ